MRSRVPPHAQSAVVCCCGDPAFLGGVQPALARVCCASARVCVCARARAALASDRERQGGATRDCSKSWGRARFVRLKIRMDRKILLLGVELLF